MIHSFSHTADTGGCRRTVMIHVPHAGDSFPVELMESVVITPEEFMFYHEKMKDSGVMQVIGHSFDDIPVISFAVSRLLCDVERFIGSEEVMEHYGMGFCYDRVYDGRTIKNVTPEIREKTLAYYTAHHKRLDAAVSGRNSILLIDLHSFTEELVMPDRKSLPMPDICIGADDSYTPMSLVEKALRLFSEAGFTVALNYPYAGSMVPNAVLSGKTECDFSTLMIEINRSIFFTEDRLTGQRNAAAIRRAMRKLIKQEAAQ